MNKLRILLSLSILFISGASMAQGDYSTGIGLRGGYPAGLTVKHFLSDQDAVEGLIGAYYRGLMITGLYERHMDAFGEERLNFYYGAGAHIGFLNYYNNHPFLKDGNGSGALIGVDGILGLEYNFEPVPINISVDWKPAFNLVGYTGFWVDNGAFSVRYIF
jgi:hypothetical protein